MSFKTGVRKELTDLTTPIFIEMLLIMMLGAIDTVMLSRHSDNSVAAVGMVNQIVMFAFLVFEVINLGTSVLCSQYIGAGRKKSVVQVVGVSLLVNIFLGLLISAILHFKAYDLLSLMGLRAELMNEGLIYMQIVGAFAFFQAISMTLSASLRSANKAFYPMMVIVVVNILNIIGNYSLIFGKFGMPQLGVEGAAISTAVARGVSMVMLIVIHFKKYIPSFPLAYFKPFPFYELKNLLKVGLPAAGEQLSYSSSQIVITYLINKTGNEALATRTYCANIIMFVYLFSMAIAQGGAICIGHLIGRGRPSAAFLLGKFVLKRSMVIVMTISVIVAIFGKNIMSLLTSNPEIIRMGTIILFIDVVLEVGRTINIFGTNALRGAGDVVYSFYVGLIFMWVVSVGCSYLFGIYFGWGIIGMWVAFTLDESVRGVIYARRWYSLKWMDKGFIKRTSTVEIG